MPTKPSSDQVPTGDLILLACMAALGAAMSGFVASYLKFMGKGPVYSLTGSHGGDGAIAGAIAAVLAFLICARFAERTLNSVAGKQSAARYIMLGIGAAIGIVTGLALTFSINFLGAKTGS